MSFTCTICRFEVVPDDVVIGTETRAGFCVCVRCYRRETVTDKPMPLALRRQLVALLAEP